MKKIGFAVLLFLFITKSAHASGGAPCQPTYGGYGGGYGSGQNCPQIAVNKQVQSPGKGGAFVDNLSVNDAHFAADQTVNFQITVSNNSGSKSGTIDIVDTFPKFVTFVSGNGNFNQDLKTLSFKIDALNPGQSQSFLISGKVVSLSDFPANQTVFCVTNQVKATESHTGTVTDSAQFCIEKGPQVSNPVTVPMTPATGPEDIALLALPSIGFLGVFLRKQTKRFVSVDKSN